MQLEVSLSVTENGKKAPDWSIDGDLDGAWSFERLAAWAKAALIEISYTALKEEQARGFDMRPMVAVDGSFSKPVEKVNPFGKIEMHARADLGNVLLKVWDKLIEKSPIDTGQFRDNHVVLHNKRVIATSRTDLLGWMKNNPTVRKGDVIRFVDLMPYARKLETQGITYGRMASPRLEKSTDKKKRSGTYVLAPNGTYFLTYRAIQSRFKAAAFIKFEWVNGGDIGNVTFPVSSYRGKRLRKTFSPNGKWGKGNRPYNYPSIKITVGEGSL